MTNPRLIQCDGIVYVTTKFPPGSLSGLVPNTQGQMRIGVGVEVRATFDNTYFMVVVSNWIRPGHDDPTPEAWDKKVTEVMQFVWDRLVERDVAYGRMPEIIKGNPLDMLPK